MQRKFFSGWASVEMLTLAWFLSVFAVGFGQTAALAQEPFQRASADGHVAELARYLDDAQIYSGVSYRDLSVYPVRLRDGDPLRGRWLTMDEALSRGDLAVTEKGGGGQVPRVTVTNGNRTENILILSGELLAGGKQTRTVRQDLVLTPGQSVEINVFCVEAHRWAGDDKFRAGGALLPQSIQRELRSGADQQRIWAEVASNNRALGAENRSESLELALNSPDVQSRLREVRSKFTPQIPEDTVGFLFVARGRAVGADFFGRHDLASSLFPKLLDAYSVDFVLKDGGGAVPVRRDDQQAAIDFFERIRRAGSQAATTPGSGSGIRTRGGGLLGDGVSLGGAVAHYGVQVQDRVIPRPVPRPGPYLPQR